MANITKVFIDVDISKKTLDICVNPMNKFFKIANAEDTIEEFIKELQQFDVKQVACEATSGYEKLFAKILKRHGHVVWIVDPRRVKITRTKVRGFQRNNLLIFNIIANRFF
jgi:transposase